MKKVKPFLMIISLLLATLVYVPNSIAHESLLISQTKHGSNPWVCEDSSKECFAQSFKTKADQVDITKVSLWLDSDYNSGYCMVGISKTRTKSHSDWEVYEQKPLENLNGDWYTFDAIDCDVEEKTLYYLMIKVPTSGKEVKVGAQRPGPYSNGNISQWYHTYGGDGWLYSNEYDFAFQIWGNKNPNPPNTPSGPSGPTAGYTGVSYTYSTSATDPDGDKIYYKFDWGDEKSIWFGPFTSGNSFSTSHSWSSAGTYQVKVRAKDVHGALSDWNTGISVKITK
jgi:hypothetical protein